MNGPGLNPKTTKFSVHPDGAHPVDETLERELYTVAVPKTPASEHEESESPSGKVWSPWKIAIGLSIALFWVLLNVNPFDSHDPFRAKLTFAFLGSLGLGMAWFVASQVWSKTSYGRRLAALFLFFFLSAVSYVVAAVAGVIATGGSLAGHGRPFRLGRRRRRARTSSEPDWCGPEPHV